jgi:hypothetical protein
MQYTELSFYFLFYVRVKLDISPQYNNIQGEFLPFGVHGMYLRRNFGFASLVTMSVEVPTFRGVHCGRRPKGECGGRRLQPDI